MLSWPADLISDVARRKCVIFLGSGVSRNCISPSGISPKTWKDFLLSAVNDVAPNKHIKTLIKENDYLTACELIKRALGQANFTSLLRREFLDPGYRPCKIHEHIFKLDSRIVATPNFDKIYETYANGQSNGTITIKNHYDPDVTSVLRETGRLIIKVHGTIDSPERMIFTRAEYAKARSVYQSFYEILEALALTHTFLFLGCGVNDPDIKLLLEDNLFKHPSSRPHIMVLPNQSIHKSVIDIIHDTMNLTILQYKQTNNHQELVDSLENLVVAVDSSRDDLKDSLNW